MRILGVVLIVIGLAALAYRGFGYTTREKVVDLGPVEVTRQDREFVPLPPVVGGLAVAVGTVLLVTSIRRTRG
jgi:hypothetical protein